MICMNAHGEFNTAPYPSFSTEVTGQPCRQGQDQRQQAVNAANEMRSAVDAQKVSQKVPNDICLNKWGHQYQAGRVSLCTPRWAEITSDYKILTDARYMKLEFSELPVQTRPMPEIKFSENERMFLRKEIKSLVDKKVIVPVEHTTGEFVSNVFLREKKDKGKYRMILNLKHLNPFTEKKHFKMETLLTTLALITPGCTLMSFDFTDAYYACNIFGPHRKYLRFYFEGQLYEFTCLPNGLSCGPRRFTKLMKIALTHLREKHDITISGYLDDNILVNYGDNQMGLEQSKIAATLFQELGFTINIPKSVVTPTTVMEHLGFIIDSNRMVVTMTAKKVQKILDLIIACLANDTTIRKVAQIIGKVNATKPANKYAYLSTKRLEIEKIDALYLNKFQYDQLMTLSDGAKEDLTWIKSTLMGSYAPVRYPNPDYTIFTDASRVGWGCHDPQTDLKGGGGGALDGPWAAYAHKWPWAESNFASTEKPLQQALKHTYMYQDHDW